MGVDHSVEGTGVFGVAVKHVEICIVFLSYNFSKSFFCVSGKILKRFLLNTSLVQQFYALLKAYPNDWVSALEVLERILFVDYAKLSGVPCLHILKHEYHQFANQVQNLKVVVLEFHFKIKTCKFAQMSIRVGILSSENRPDLENTL